MNLRIPGPTPMPPEVLEAISHQTISHRGGAYEELQRRVIENLKVFFQTKNDIYLLTCSGTGGFEFSVSNFFSPGDKILSFTCGEFGKRWADCARAFHADVIETKFEIGTAINPDTFKKVLSEHPDAKGIFVTHNETAVGVLNPVGKLAGSVKLHPNHPLFCVDAVSSLGGVNLEMALGIDVLFTGSQKAWMAPAGLCMASVSPKAWDFYSSSKNPKYYFDISSYKKFNEKNQTPATPAISALFGLDKSLELMLKIGKERVFSHHMEMKNYTREKLKENGFSLFVEDEFASQTLTSIKLPDGNDGSAWTREMKEKYGVVVAGGMGEAKGKIIRIAHMGYAVGKEEMDEAIEALKEIASDK